MPNEENFTRDSYLIDVKNLTNGKHSFYSDLLLFMLSTQLLSLILKRAFEGMSEKESGKEGK
jgi:hypothetical protein